MYYLEPTEKDLATAEKWLDKNVDAETLENVEDIGTELQANTAINTNSAFQNSQGLIRNIASRYTNLDTTVCLDDLLNQSYFGFRAAIQKYNMEHFGKVKFSTILTWYIQKCFQSLCSPAFMAAEVVSPDGERKIIHYNEFQKIKRHLPVRVTSPDGREVKYMPLSEFKTAEDSLPIGTRVKPSEYNVISTIRSLDYTSSSDEDGGSMLDTELACSGDVKGWNEEEKRVVKAIDRKRREEKKKADGK